MHILGVNINTVPVLDVRNKKSHNSIGDRAFSTNPEIVSKIGDFCIKEFHKNNIGTVVKHIPGQGLAKVDSHKATPIVKAKLKKLNKTNFFSFKNKKSLFAMTAHVIYKDIDRSICKVDLPNYDKTIKIILKKIIKCKDINKLKIFLSNKFDNYSPPKKYIKVSRTI